MSLPKDQREILYYSILPSTILSLLGTIFVALLYTLFISLQKFPFKIVFILSVFDLFHSIGFLIPTYNSTGSDLACQLQAGFLQFFTIGSVLWTSFIALSLYQIIVKSSSFTERNLKYFLITILIICFISTLIPYLNNSFGLVAGWCWIKQSTKSFNYVFYERYFFFFIPIWCIIISNVLMYCKVSLTVKNTSIDNRTIRSLNKKLKFYPIILVLCFLPYTIKSILELLNEPFFIKHKFELTIIAGVCRTSIGFFNGVVYGLTKRVRNSIRLLFVGSQRNTSEIGILIKSVEQFKA